MLSEHFIWQLHLEDSCVFSEVAFRRPIVHAFVGGWIRGEGPGHVRPRALHFAGNLRATGGERSKSPWSSREASNRQSLSKFDREGPCQQEEAQNITG